MVRQLEYLASDVVEGRATGSKGERLAGEFVAGVMSEIGLSKAGDSLWYQAFTFTPKPSVRKLGSGDSARVAMSTVKQLTGRNVLGAIDRGADRWIIIGAHYDHLGKGDDNSLAAGDTAIHRGADDNASGVAALLELAKRLSVSPVETNLLFIAFSGEEKGLFGSKHFVNHPTIPFEKVIAMLNMDMVGRMNDDRALAIHGTGTSPTWPNLINDSNTDQLKLLFHESGVGPSDHTSFYLADVPVLHFFTGQHDDYHKPSDAAEKINYAGLLSVTNLVERVVRSLDEAPAPTFTKTQDQAKNESPRFKVTLGIVPDYMQEGTGLRLDGVSEDRPAHRSGIIKGDVIIGIGEHVVNDIYGYMEALGFFNQGDQTTVRVMRGDREKMFEVVFD